MPQWRYCIYTVKRTSATQRVRTIDYCDGKGPQAIQINSSAGVLQDLGQKGWELVTVVNYSGHSPIEEYVRYYFKR